jgi:hypothetical protein
MVWRPCEGGRVIDGCGVYDMRMRTFVDSAKLNIIKTKL